MDDPLAKFRKDKPSPLPALVVASEHLKDVAASEPYSALGMIGKTRGGRLDIRVKEGYSHAVAYQFLYEIVYDRKDYRSVFLIFNSLSATLEGRNLRSVVDAIRLGSADYIAEFDETEHALPDDLTLPFIEKLTVVSAAEVRARKAANGE